MPKPFEADDLFLHRRIAKVHCTPSSERAACAVESLDRDGDRYQSAIWTVPLDGGPPRPLTAGTGLDDDPQVSPDGRRVAFLSDRADGQPQIHLIDVDGGEARQLSRFTQGAVSHTWSPDGKSLLVTCAVGVDPDRRGQRDPDGPKRTEGGPELCWRLPYKADGLGYTLDQEVHLFRIDADTGDSVQLTDGPFDVRGACWSPDGRQVAFTRTREGRHAHRTDLWIANADGSEARQLTREQASASSPAWSPDGRWIVFLGAVADGDAQMRTWLVDVEAQRVSALGPDDVEVATGEEPHWAEDSSRVFLVRAERGLQGVYSLAMPSGKQHALAGGERHLSTLGLTARHLVYSAESPAQAKELWVSDRDGTHERRLTHFNAWWDERCKVQVEIRRFEVPDGEGGTESIEGWLVRPAQAKGATPWLVDVHGGPASYALLAYTSHPYWQVLCSRGWSLLALNPVGSSSYGRRFSERLRGRWGEMDLQQHLSVVKQLQEEGSADDRLAIAGKSYGGYLSAWAIGQTALFRAAVVTAPVTNLETHYGTSDSGYYADPYSMLGEPFIDREQSQRLSPTKHVQNARTPTLLLQGKEDERCPKSQSEEMFVTLMCCGETPAEMVLYPGGSHHFLESGKPSHRLDAVQRLIGWLEQWIDVPVDADGPRATGARSDGQDEGQASRRDPSPAERVPAK